MDLHHQEAILELSKRHERDELLVLIGAPDPESAGISAETVVLGDPSYAGPLAGTQLGLDVYHVLEPEVRQAVPPDVWEQQVGVMADILDTEGVSAAVAGLRQQGGSPS
jgi:glycine reductase